MANADHLAVLKQGSTVWNQWRKARRTLVLFRISVALIWNWVGSGEPT
jgi:hypothetical protein